METAKQPRSGGRPDPAGHPSSLHQLSVEELVDQLGDLDAKLAPMRQMESTATQLRKLLAARLGLQPEESRMVQGFRFGAMVGAAGFQTRIVDMVDLFKHLTKKVFLEHCGFTLEKLKELVAEPARSTFVATAQTGPRQVKTYTLQTPSAEQKAA